MVQFDYLSQWEDNYNSGKEINLYPFSDLVSSYFHSQKLLPTFSEKSLRALDIGCGCGNNLWFLAEQGMDVIGVDVSPTAIKYAEKIMKDRNVKGEAIVSTFQNFSGQIESFDQYVVLLRNTVTQMVYKHAISTIVPGRAVNLNATDVTEDAQST